MSAGARVSLIPKEGAPTVLCRIEVSDTDLIGHDAVLTVRQKVTVKDSRPVNGSNELLRREFRLTSNVTELEFPAKLFKGFSYRGRHIDIDLETRLKVDDGLLFDTKITDKQQMTLRMKPAIKVDSEAMIEPTDRFSFFDNLKAIPFKAQVITLVLLVAAGIVILINTAVGVHDQFSPETQTWFYSHTDSDGDGQSPLVNSLVGSGALGAGIWFLMKKQLRKYMTFRFRKLPARIQRRRRYRMANLVQGKPRVMLEDVRVRVVACNMECGQYKRGSGTDERTVSFSEPVRAVLLFEKTLSSVPAGSRLAGYLDDKFSFDPMFDALYPPQMISGSHGIDIYWEVQLIHDNFVDQELVGPKGGFRHEDFLYDSNEQKDEQSDYDWPKFG